MINSLKNLGNIYIYIYIYIYTQNIYFYIFTQHICISDIKKDSF